MKNEQDKNKKITQPEAASADIDWFRQFDDMPGVEQVYTPEELNILKSKMLSNIIKKINEQD